MENKTLNDDQLQETSGGRLIREKKKQDFLATTGKFNDIYDSLLKAKRGEEARDLLMIYLRLDNKVRNSIANFAEDSEDILFSKLMQPYWPK